MLKYSGWAVAPFYEEIYLSALKAHAIEDFPTANGPADDAVVVKEGCSASMKRKN